MRARLIVVTTTAGVHPENGQQSAHVQELESGVTSGQGIVVVLWEATRWAAVDGAQRREIRTIDRVEEVPRAELEHLRR